MEYRNIRTGQKLIMEGLPAEVVQVDPRRIQHAGGPAGREWLIGDPIQVKVVLHPGDEPSLLWVNPNRLIDSTR